MKTSAELTRRQVAAERHARTDAAYRGQQLELEHDDALEQSSLTAGFDRAHAERLGPGCYRVRAAPMHR